jgi:hypothetical protein
MFDLIRNGKIKEFYFSVVVAEVVYFPYNLLSCVFLIGVPFDYYFNLVRNVPEYERNHRFINYRTDIPWLLDKNMTVNLFLKEL